MTRSLPGALAFVHLEELDENIHGVDVTDLDLDGRDDVLLFGPNGGVTPIFHRGLADGTVADRLLFGVHAGRPVDLDGDLFPDLLSLRGVAWNQLDPTFCILGEGTHGSFGVPVLSGSGSLEAGASFGMSLDGALPHAAMLLVIGTSAANTPAFGGTLVPSVTIAFGPVPLSAAGTFEASTTAPTLPPGTQLWFQALVADPQGTSGVAMSNALLAES